MAKFLTEVSKLGTAVKDTGKDIIGSPQGMVDAFKGKGALEVERSVGSKVASGIGSTLLWPVKKSGQVALWAIEQPLAFAAKGARHGVSTIGSFYKKAPLIAVPLTAIAGIAAVNSGIKHRAAARTQAAQEQAMLEALQYQQQAPVAQANTYQLPDQVTMPAAANDVAPMAAGPMTSVTNAQYDGPMQAQQRVATR